MYRAHAAREDTVLFPALRGLVGKKEYEEMGEQFEDTEKSLLGGRPSRAGVVVRRGAALEFQAWRC